MRSGQKIRVGVVGAGFGRYGLVPAFWVDPRGEVAALCCTSSTKARTLADELDIPLAFGDFEQMIREAGLTAVAIATPPVSQSAIAECALRHGVAVFVEKPVAASIAQAENLMRLATQAHVANMVDFLFPEIAVWREGARLLADGAIGTVHTCVVNWIFQSYDHRHSAVTWKTDAKLGGGVVSHFASHTLYYLEFFLGRMCRLNANLSKPENYTRPSQPLLALSAHFANGATGIVVVCSNAYLGNGHRVEFHGDQGSLVINSPSATAMNDFTLWLGRSGEPALQRVPVAEPQPLASSADSRVEPVSRLVSRFLDWIETGVDTHPNLSDGLRVQNLIEAIYYSNQQQTPVEV